MNMLMHLITVISIYILISHESFLHSFQIPEEKRNLNLADCIMFIRTHVKSKQQV